jgi:hypothetical protein
MRKTDEDALFAMHAGLYGMVYPTYKMIPQPSGAERLLMHAATLEERDGVTVIAEFGSETIDPNPKRRNSGYSDSVIERLEAEGLARLHHGGYDHYPVLLLTPAGIERVTGMFGEPVATIPYVDPASGDDRLLLREPQPGAET